MDKIPVIILGAGGHAKVLIDTIRLINKFNIIGITDVNKENIHSKFLGITIIGDDQILSQYDTNEIQLVNGLGSTASTNARKELFLQLTAKNYTFASVIHPTAYVSSYAHLAQGVQVMAGAIIQASSVIGENVIINTGASIDHDNLIEAHSHIAPRATLCGNVKVGSASHIGCGAVLKENIVVGADCFVAAGAVVVKNLNSNVKVKGIPAREYNNA